MIQKCHWKVSRNCVFATYDDDTSLSPLRAVDFDKVNGPNASRPNVQFCHLLCILLRISEMS